MVSACSSGILTNVLPHRNVMPQTQDTTPHHVTVYRQGANLSLCYPLMWNITLDYTATHFIIWGKTRPGNPTPTFYTTSKRSTDSGMVVVSWKLQMCGFLCGNRNQLTRVVQPDNKACRCVCMCVCVLNNFK